jgi:hypothetical protein
MNAAHVRGHGSGLPGSLLSGTLPSSTRVTGPLSIVLRTEDVWQRCSQFVEVDGALNHYCYFDHDDSFTSTTLKTVTRGMSSVRYGTRLGDLKNKQSTHTVTPSRRCSTFVPSSWAIFFQKLTQFVELLFVFQKLAQFVELLFFFLQKLAQFVELLEEEERNGASSCTGGLCAETGSGRRKAEDERKRASAARFLSIAGLRARARSRSISLSGASSNPRRRRHSRRPTRAPL